MFVGNETYDSVSAYISGYAQGSKDSPISGAGWTAFNNYVCASYRFPFKYVWTYVFKVVAQDDRMAIDLMCGKILEFTEKLKTETYEEIVAKETQNAQNVIEGEAEVAWRHFSRAIHRGDRNEIEPLILENKDSNILWESSYPKDVAEALDSIQESNPICRIRESKDGHDVTIMTPDFGVLEVKKINGSWKVDASKIINRWMRNKSEEAE